MTSRSLYFAKVLASLAQLAWLPALGACGGPSTGSVEADATEKLKAEVVFSPQPLEESHLARVAELIDSAESSLDIAMYSFSDAGISEALERAVERGVRVRFLFETANADRKLEGAALASSKSGKLEKIGVDVRYVNKIMHHKLMIVDGPRADASAAKTATIVSGSGNWSNGAATRYDENTIVLRGSAELTLKLQAEFDLLWDHSRDFSLEEPLPAEPSASALPLEFPDDAAVDALFTSANFSVKDTTFRVTGSSVVAEALVEAIGRAKKSILVASGHLRSRPVAEALMAKARENPEMDIRVYLDGQEYISAWADEDQRAELEACLEEAGESASKQRACTDRGFLFGLEVERAGIPVRYKYYAYRWNASYAEQMHHKYMLVDGKDLYTGSYNLSDNAEHNTFENVLVFRGSRASRLVDAFEENFEAIWETGEAEGRLESLVEQVESGDDFPLVFPPMALGWDAITDLKERIRASCPDVDTEPYRREPASHMVCRK